MRLTLKTVGVRRTGKTGKKMVQKDVKNYARKEGAGARSREDMERPTRIPACQESQLSETTEAW